MVARLSDPQERDFSESRSTVRWRRIGGGASFLLVVALMAPIVSAGFHPEDFGWLALARQTSTPWPLVAHNIDFVYFYRPLPLLLWWLSAHACGTAAAWHNALDVFLHAVNAALICALAARVARSAAAGAVAGLVFAALPAAAATAAWMSDRFDVMALGFSLASLLAFEAALERRRTPWLGASLLLAALLSKELAFSAAAIMLVRLAIDGVRGREWRWSSIAAIVAACAVALSLRVLSGTVADTSIASGDLPRAFVAGVTAWWQRAPSALSGFQAHAVFLPCALGALAVVALIGVVRDRKSSLVLVGYGMVLIGVPALLQWPVTSLVLTDDTSVQSLENLRFYYFAAAGLALLIAAAMGHLPPRWRIGFAACVIAIGAAAAVRTSSVAHAWSAAWSGQSESGLRVSADLATRSFPRGCRIYLEADGWPESSRVHADTIIKAGAPADAPLQGCAIFAGSVVYQSLLHADQCDIGAWPGLAFAQSNGVTLASVLGDLCLAQFATWRLDQLGAPLYRFRVDSNGGVRELSE